MLKSVIFDLDGTLVDTEPSAAAVVQEYFLKHGHPLEASDAHYVTGRTWAKAFDFLFGKYPISEDRASAELSIMAAYRKSIQEKLHLVPGGAEAVRALSGHFSLGLVSGSNRSEVLFALDQLGIRKLFQVILGAEDYPASKPAPDGFQKALKLLNCLPEECIVFEDSAAGIASARSAGTWVVAITGTNHLNQDNTQAHERIADLRSVDAEWVRARLASFAAKR